MRAARAGRRLTQTRPHHSNMLAEPDIFDRLVAIADLPRPT